MFHKQLSKQLSLFTIVTLAISTVPACQSGAGDDEYESSQERLQALLRDEPLAQLPPGAEAAAPSGGGAGATGKPGGGISSIILPTANPIGVWSFDDCTPSRTGLADSSPNGNPAFRSVNVTCTDGIQNSRAVAIAAPEDIVYVPDQPSFTFESGVTVAGWVKPAVIGGTRTLFRRRDKGTSSFALMLNAGKFEWIVNLGNNTAISVISPAKAKAGVYQHVAATFDGATARLYVDGALVNSFAAAGSIPIGPGPLLMGNDGSERRFAGSLDAMLFATHPLTAAEVSALTCFPQTPTITVSSTNLSSPPGVPATIDVALKNNNPASCAPLTFSLTSFSFDSQLVLAPASAQSAPVPSGATGHMTVTATPSELVEPGANLFFEFLVSEPVTGASFFPFGTLTVTEPTGCHVNASRELMIKSTTVVDDPVRTKFSATSTDARNGVWTFKHLMENMAPTPADASAMVEAMLGSFTSSQEINGFLVSSRPGMQSVLGSWPRTSGGALDLARAPLRLTAIVNRFDLRDLAHGDAGEARFVFEFLDSGLFFPLQATLILEYKLPAATEQDVLDWAQAFHALGAKQFGESYNAALQAITERFAGRNARPGHPNGSAINAVRTNEIAFGFDGLWQMRQFELSAATGMLVPAPLALTPDRGFNNTDTLAAFIGANQADILADRHTVPSVLDGAPFQAGAVFNDLSTWFAPAADPDARHHFAVNTCNGCHSTAETGTFFLQIGTRFPGSESSLSGFLTGTTRNDPVTGQPRTFNDLSRRSADLKAIVCATPAMLAGSSGPILRKGIARVH